MAFLHYSSSQITLSDVQSFIFIMKTELTVRGMYTIFLFQDAIDYIPTINLITLVSIQGEEIGD